MENSSPIITWAKANQRFLEVKIRRLTWIDDWLPGAWDFECSIRVGAHRFVGRGTAFDRTVSLEKALSEAVERAVVFDSQIESSNGVAAYPTRQGAEHRALQELVERHLYMNHHYRCLSMDKIESNSVILSHVKPLLDSLVNCDVGLEVYEMTKLGSFRTTMVRLNGHRLIPKFGSVIGLGSRKNLSDSVAQSLFEAARKLAYCLVSGDRNSLSLEEFKSLESPSIVDHGLLGRNYEYSVNLNYDTSTRSGTECFQDITGETKFTLLQSSSAVLGECPVYVVLAENKKMTKVIFGQRNMETLKSSESNHNLTETPHIMS